MQEVVDLFNSCSPCEEDNQQRGEESGLQILSSAASNCIKQPAHLTEQNVPVSTVRNTDIYEKDCAFTKGKECVTHKNYKDCKSNSCDDSVMIKIVDSCEDDTEEEVSMNNVNETEELLRDRYRSELSDVAGITTVMEENCSPDSFLKSPKYCSTSTKCLTDVLIVPPDQVNRNIQFGDSNDDGDVDDDDHVDDDDDDTFDEMLFEQAQHVTQSPTTNDNTPSPRLCKNESTTCDMMEVPNIYCKCKSSKYRILLCLF